MSTQDPSADMTRAYARVNAQYLAEIGELARRIEDHPEIARGKALQIRQMVEKALREVQRSEGE